ncbi:MAG: helix-turn-helix transcriptional regulator [Lachnospiraceae bacterium]|nr:helix-turn-helix transcriptional regulator [Lachnospiraceae bacterium]
MHNTDTNTPKCNYIISVNLSRMMKNRNISRRKLSSDLGIKYTTLCDWLNGNSVPRAKSITALAGYFGVSESDFFIDTESTSDASNRLSRYKEELTLNLSAIEFMSDEQIKELLKRGFTFKHRSLEEYAELTGRPIVGSEEIDFGEPQGDEIW